MSNYIYILCNAIYNHYLFGKMRESFLIFPRSIFIKSSLVIRPSITVSWTLGFSSSEWSTVFVLPPRPPDSKVCENGTVTHFALRGTLPVWDLLFLLPYMMIVTGSCHTSSFDSHHLMLHKRYSRAFTTEVTRSCQWWSYPISDIQPDHNLHIDQ